MSFFSRWPALVSAFLVGCSGGNVTTMPEAYPVQGTLVGADGAPVTEGTLTFRSKSDPTLSVTGTVKPDGSFTLVTIKDSLRAEGVPEGEYDVTLIRPLDGGKDAEVLELPSATVAAGGGPMELKVPKK